MKTHDWWLLLNHSLEIQSEGHTGFASYRESALWKSKAGVLVYKDRGGLKIDLATGQN